MPTSQTRLLAVDLDGTLLNAEHQAGGADYQALKELGRRSCIRIAATGRSLHSSQRVLPPDFPIDYLAFSSGVGIFDWKQKKILHTCELPAADVERAVEILRAHRTNFMVHKRVPENHHFFFERNGKTTGTDFDRRIANAHAFARPLDTEGTLPASQLLAVLPPDPRAFHRLAEKLVGFTVIRATSPLDGESIWCEVFSQNVSKGHACAWLSANCGVNLEETYAVGNDFNDLHMLDWAAQAAVVANAPEELRSRFPTVASHNDNGVAEAVRSWGLLSQE